MNKQVLQPFLTKILNYKTGFHTATGRVGYSGKQSVKGCVRQERERERKNERQKGRGVGAGG